MTETQPPLTEQERARMHRITGDAIRYYRCCLCGFLTDEDEIVWTGPMLTKGVCHDCEPEGDDS